MTNKLPKILLIAVLGILALAACGSDSEDVPSLATKDTQEVKPTQALDDEAKVMAFVQCMRDQGIEFKDPMVDAEGNVQVPEFVEGFTITREEFAEPYAACSHHLEGLTLGRERADLSEQLDKFVALAACLRDKGYDLDDPTAETLQVWLTDFRVEFDWDDPKAMAAYEECSGAE
jgi:hypothetical protein